MIAKPAELTPTSMKILTIGPPNGSLASLVAKATAIESKHGPFQALFVAGDFFSSSDALNEEEARFYQQGANETDLRLPIPTYISHSRRPPPSQVLELIERAEANAPSTSKSSPTHSQDHLPVKIAHNLFWLGKDRVNWVSRDDPLNSAVASTADGAEQIVDEGAERNGLRVAVCGGQWDKVQWAQEIQGMLDGPATAEAPLAAADATSNAISPLSLEKLYSHRGFGPIDTSQNATSETSQQQPQTLAAARQALLAANAAQSDTSSHPAIDILMLSSWPSSLSLFSKTFPPAGLGDEARSWGLAPFAEAARRSCPRYIFAPPPEEAENCTISKVKDHGVFWEREPYSTAVPIGPSASQVKVTRFVSLARFGNAEKVRWFVALNLTLGSGSLEPPKGATPSPFGPPPTIKRKSTGANGETGAGLDSEVNFRWQQGRGGKRQKRSTAESGPSGGGPPPPGYICRVCGSQDHYVRECSHRQSGAAGGNGLPSKPEGAEEALGPRRPRRAPVEMVGPSDCWFCLSNTGCAKHLVVAIGNESYVALPKGQLPPAEDAASPVPGGGHVLIVPIGHTPSIEATGEDAAKRLKAEMEGYLSSLAKLYESYGCSMVCWSVVKLSNTRAGHLQIQCLPVPEARVAADPQGPGPLLPFLLRQAESRGWHEGESGSSGLAELPQSKAGPDGNRLALHNKGDEYFELHVSTPGDGQDRGAKSTTHLLDLSPSRRIRFDYQFARSSLAQYLGVPQRADWRACARASDTVEAAETRVFRDAYREFMPEDDDDDDDDD
ncbi:unnamed protein product [Parajaminaea phylloscopi]